MGNEQTSHPSSSTEQLQAESRIRTVLATHLKVEFSPQPQELEALKLDAYSAGPQPILVEIFARVGRSKAGQKRKLCRDMTKLLLAERKLGVPCRKIIAVIDREAVAHLDGGWDGEFAREFGFEIEVVPIGSENQETVAEAQRRQCR